MNLLKRLFQSPAIKREIDEELRFHLEQRTAENIAAGMSPEEAAREARKRFGNMQSVREECRETRGANFGEATVRDVRFGLRMLRKNPGFTTVAVLTLAVCLGANLTIFAVINSVLLRPLPFPEADRLVTMFNSYPKMNVARAESSFPNYYYRRGHIAAFSRVAAYHDTTAIVGEAGATELTDILRISPEFFATLGVNPILGRAFTEEEMTYQTDGVVILTDGYWRQKFNGDPGVLGRSLRVDGLSKTIVGVLPPDFRFLSSKARIFHPLSSDPGERGIGNLHSPKVNLIARLQSGVALSQAQAQIDANDLAMAKDFPQADIVAKSGYRTVVTPLHADHVASIRPTILLMQAGAFTLLLIGGVNLVNLLLVRASARSKELAIRQSLGASRQQVVRQAMVETGLLSLGGGLFGLAVGAAGIRLLQVLGVEQLPLGSQIAFDGRLALVALLGAVVTGIAVGLPIAWFNLRCHLASALQSDSRGGTTGHAAQSLRHGFIVAQIALAFVLLAGAGLLGLSLKRVLAVSPGFHPDHLLAGQITLPWISYPDWPARLAFAERLTEKARQLPSVVAAGLITDVPVNGSHDLDVITVVGHAPDPGSPPILHNYYGVEGDYFAAMGIPLREGRFLERADAHRQPHVCVVDEDFARTYWPKRDAVGQRVFMGTPEGQNPDDAYTIVGIVGAVKQAQLTDAKPGRAIYLPYRYVAANKVFLVTRTSLAPGSLDRPLQKMVRQIDPELPVYDLRTMEIRIADSLIARRSPALLAGIFASVALLLAAIGTYGVLSFAVAQRRREIGVRMALGALPAQIARQFLSLGLRVLLVGTIIGVGGAWLAGRAMQSILFEVPPLHIATIAGTALLMSAVTLIACLLPARRAAKVDPMVALRYE